jgi:hypothetical protein
MGLCLLPVVVAPQHPCLSGSGVDLQTSAPLPMVLVMLLYLWWWLICVLHMLYATGRLNQLN